MNNTIYENHLISEKSPYLLQHAHNPVNWYPWDEEVFRKAQAEDKMIFLSIGYSTCHWCHVMAHECFEDPEVSQFLNEHFLAVKVDREERPDIDSIYMDACVKANGSGGWPLSILIDWEKQPLYLGTYFPKNTFLKLLKNILNLWINDRDLLLQYSQSVLNIPDEEDPFSETIDENIPEDTFQILNRNYDEEFGGFFSAPKFPMPSNLLFLMKYYLCTENPVSLQMVMKTLDHMRSGGIYDQIGFGFSRYSTDRKWLIPHFEKMLYDNALLMMAYALCYQISRDEKYAQTVRETATYLLRNLKGKKGGFYTAEDADSEGVEGKFYVFAPVEIRKILSEDSDAFCRFYHITSSGNFQGYSVPNQIGNENQVQNFPLMETLREKVFAFREKRIHPAVDDKILTSLNGLAMAAFAMAGKYLIMPDYIKTAENIASFLEKTMMKNGKLYARYRDGETKYLGYDDDYSYLIFGLLELHQATLNQKYLDMATSLAEVFISGFYDEEKGGFYQNDKDGETILYRKKEIYDGAVPSSNSVAIYNFYRLSDLTENEKYREISEKSLRFFNQAISRYPALYSFGAISVLYHIHRSVTVVLVGNTIEDVSMMKKAVEDSRSPFISVRYEQAGSLYGLINNLPTAYVCKGSVCLAPISDIESFYEILRI